MEQEKKLEDLVRPSNLIELRDIPGKGRGFIAVQDLKVGDLLFIEDPIRSPPYSSTNGLPPKEATNELARKIKEHPLFEKFYYDPTKLLEKDELAQARAVLRTNAFRTRDASTDNKWMETFCPYCSFFNHSCWPNATMYRTSKNQIKVYAIDDIKKDTEVCITYSGELFVLSQNMRQQFLKKGWNFDCTCARCLTPRENDAFLSQTTRGMDNDEIEEMKKAYDEILKEAGEKKTADKQWVRKLESFLKLPLHQCHWRKFKVRQIIVEVYISDPDKFDKAKDHLEAYTKLCQIILPKYHNVKLMHFNTYRQVCTHLKMKQETIEENIIKMDDAYKKILEMYVINDK